MEVGRHKFHRRALAALNQLEEGEQAQVQEALAALPDTPAARWSAAQARRLPGDQPLYLVRLDDSLRAFVQAAQGQEPEVLDIVRQETLKSFARAPGNSGRRRSW
jgi:hypothetical protein